MKMLLTSGGINNDSIHNALLDLLEKPIAECSALYVPTALHGHPMIGPKTIYSIITGKLGMPMAELGWESVGMLELTALPSMNKELWDPLVRETDVLLVEGGDAMYLSHWMKESGLAEMLPELSIVYVGLSAGSMVVTPRIGEQFVNWPEPRSNDETLGLVGFSIFPHLEYPGWETNTMASAEKWFANIDGSAYAIDDDTAIKVVDGEIEVISEGKWKHLTKEENP